MSYSNTGFKFYVTDRDEMIRYKFRQKYFNGEKGHFMVFYVVLPVFYKPKNIHISIHCIWDWKLRAQIY